MCDDQEEALVLDDTGSEELQQCESEEAIVVVQTGLGKFAVLTRIRAARSGRGSGERAREAGWWRRRSAGTHSPGEPKPSESGLGSGMLR